MGSVTPRRVLAAAAVSICVGLAVVTLLWGYAGGSTVRALQTLSLFAAGLMVIGGGVIWVVLSLADWRQPASEAEFEELVRRSERLAAGEVQDGDWEEDDDVDELGWDELDPYDETDFDSLVRAALDDLPVEFHRALHTVPVVVSDGGRRRRAYGLYEGDGVARDNYPDRILIFRDTLLRDFGGDPEELRAQVTRTVRHELAHHLGWDERGVEGLGL